MEGLIPKVYKSIKRSMTVKEPFQSYNIADFYPDGYNYKYPQQENPGSHLVSTKRSQSSKNNSDFVNASDRGVYSVPNVVGGESAQYNAYFGWESTSGSVSGYHRFSNYMDKCSGGNNYLTVNHGKVNLRSLTSLESLAFADWKSINPPKHLNHREFRFWVSRGTGKCLTVFGGNSKKRTVGVADCKFNGANKGQLFAFRFHYHNSFCCCGRHND
nr:50S ribosomal protein like [Tanacetum cinerariifolium]